ncbi:unnamed protein product [marine sediment metagenome]|uniref:AdoMet activation domain-containing protein n=1 Tax=marine sediment metagenome TaxID=412755 RepID=X1L8G7_9ZZZZ
MNIIKNMQLDMPDDIGRDFLTKLMGGRLVPRMEEMLEDKREICIDVLEPAAVYDTFDIRSVEGDSVYFKSDHIFNGPNISKILKGSEIASIFIYTLGEKIDYLIKKEQDTGDTLGTIIMDAITTSMLGVVGEYVGKIIKDSNTVQKGYGATCTYSPGQYKWTIEEQKEIFSMVDSSKIGVSLNKSFLMIPFKSVSGIYGFGPEDMINKTRVACDLCPRGNCIGRR